MFKDYLCLLLLAHIAGDFYLQTQPMADKKDKDINWVFIHCLCYWLTMMIVLMPVIDGKTIKYGTLAALLHTMVDIAKYFYLSKKVNVTAKREYKIFFLDQGVHILGLIFVAYLFVRDMGVLRVFSQVSDFFHITGISGNTVVCWVTALLIVHKPANIAISKMLSIYRPENKDTDRKQDYNAGRFIGTIERIIILIFISLSQYAAIGLVLTAKSVARYEKIAKEPEFAEYYLLGTLLSTLAAIVSSLIL